MHMLKKRQLGGEGGEEGRTAAALFSSLAASSPPSQGQPSLHGPLSKSGDRAKKFQLHFRQVSGTCQVPWRALQYLLSPVRHDGHRPRAPAPPALALGRPDTRVTARRNPAPRTI